MRSGFFELREDLPMSSPHTPAFDVATFLSQAGVGRTIVPYGAGQHIFTQGNSADCVFYLQSGRAKLTVVSASGKEATITLLAVGDFVGEESMAGAVGLRMASATAVTACTAMKIERNEM